MFTCIVAKLIRRLGLVVYWTEGAVHLTTPVYVSEKLFCSTIEGAKDSSLIGSLKVKNGL